MPISPYIKETMTSKGASVIRKMFEEGTKLKAQYGADKVFDFSLGNPDLDPPDEVLDAIERLAKCREKNYHGYMPNAGYPFARDAMAAKTQSEQGVPVTGDCVVMSVGAAGALNSLLKAILTEGDNIVVPAPFFTEYRHYVHNFGGTLIEVPTKSDFSIDTDAIAKVLTEKTAAVLINSPNNPTGRVYSDDDIQALAAVLDAHAKKCGRKPYLICVKPNCPDKADVVAACIFTTRILGYVNAPALFQRVVSETWNAKADYSLYEKRRNELMAILDEAKIKYAKPEGAFYLFCKVPECYHDDDMAFCDYLKKYFILCAPGSGFGGKGWFRMAYCVSDKTIANCEKAFVEAMKNIK